MTCRHCGYEVVLPAEWEGRSGRFECLPNRVVQFNLGAAWTSVAERLPEEGKSVLGFTIHDGCRVLHRDEGEWWDLNGWLDPRIVIHWMPLPEAPK